MDWNRVMMSWRKYIRRWISRASKNYWMNRTRLKHTNGYDLLLLPIPSFPYIFLCSGDRRDAFESTHSRWWRCRASRTEGTSSRRSHWLIILVVFWICSCRRKRPDRWNGSYLLCQRRSPIFCLWTASYSVLYSMASCSCDFAEELEPQREQDRITLLAWDIFYLQCFFFVVLYEPIGLSHNPYHRMSSEDWKTPILT